MELKEFDGVFGTEPSKVVDPNWGLWEDGIYSAVMLTQYLSKSDVSLNDLLGIVPYSVYLQRNVRVRPFSSLGCRERNAEQEFMWKVIV